MVQAGILSAQRRNTAGQGFDIGDTLCLAVRGADKHISQLIIFPYFLRRNHSCEYNLFLDSQTLGQAAKPFLVRPVSCNEKCERALRLLRLKPLEISKDFFQIFFLCQTAYTYQHLVFLRNFPLSLQA